MYTPASSLFTASAPSSPRLRITPQASDTTAVRSIVEETGFFSKEEEEIAVEIVQEALQKGRDSGYFFVFAEEPQGTVIGYACFGPIPGSRGSFDVYWIAVRPSLQSRGIGRLLMAASEDVIREEGGRLVFIDTASRPQYVPTHRFYERCGYIEEARLKDFYDVGDSKVIFRKEL